MTAPASATLSVAPWKTRSSCASGASSGHAAMLSAKSTSPPIAKTSDIAFAAPIAPEAYASSTIGGKKSSVSPIATSGAMRYTAASSLGFRPTSSSAGLDCCCRGRRTCASGPGPSFAPQPAQVASVVRRTSSRVNTRSVYVEVGGAQRTCSAPASEYGRVKRGADYPFFREVRSPFDDYMLRPLDPRCRVVQFSRPLTDDEYPRLALFLDDYPSIPLRAYGSFAFRDLEFLRHF